MNSANQERLHVREIEIFWLGVHVYGNSSDTEKNGDCYIKLNLCDNKAILQIHVEANSQ